MSKTRCLKLKKGILQGKMLAIDPTSGSYNSTVGENSQAGWAYFDGAVLMSSGVIDIPADPDKDVRFRSLLHILQTEFADDYDVLAMEDIPMARGRGGFATSQTLIQACGVYIGGLSGSLVELNSHTWQAIARRLGGWEKGDESDAQYIGLAAIAFASGYSQKLTVKYRLEFAKDLAAKHNYWNLPLMKESWR